MNPSVPFQEVPHKAAEILGSFGGEVSDLYRALANDPQVLEAWIRMAWGLRNNARTDRALREVMILRSAYSHSATYQWSDHVAMASRAGVTSTKIAAISSWEESGVFSPTERLVLALMDEMMAASVTDSTLADLEREFDASERVELIVTAGFYCMVPRVLDALRLEG